MGKNPFIDAEAPPLPSRAYTLTVNTSDGASHTIPVDPNNLPEAHEGHSGGLLSLMLEAGLDIDHTCGGVCACSTCHVFVRKGLDSAPEAIEEEEDQLDFAPGVDDDSRLACQCVPNGSVDVVVELPGWTRNEVSEDH
ncbi:MAG: 2Fe-2S iron-sulfur cluster-binding protein [Myxococcota bacterium]|nr:2Fe-2S iron-sulfur cluster-binding protein [Myxococcota bacterium]